MRSIALSCLLMGILIACQTEVSRHNSEHQTFAEEDHYFIPGLDHGLSQSPINILSAEAETGKHSVTVNFTGNIEDVQNLGHTVQLDIEPGNTITVDGETFEFKQIHFHTPSEHLIDGITYPMEIHVVNTLAGQSADETTEYLVVSMLLKMGQENRLIKQFINEIPEEENTPHPIDLNVVKESRFFSFDSTANDGDLFYHYRGSLTTPPYTESVRWFIFKEILEASPEQIRTINEIEGDNARHIQSRNRRGISN